MYVCGAVNAPGVYELEKDARVFEAIGLAGGMTGKLRRKRSIRHGPWRTGNRSMSRQYRRHRCRAQGF